MTCVEFATDDMPNTSSSVSCLLSATLMSLDAFMRRAVPISLRSVFLNERAVLIMIDLELSFLPNRLLRKSEIVEKNSGSSG